MRRLDYSETSQILSVFAREHGLLRVIAKGAKRTTKAGASKFDGGLDLLDVGEAVFIHTPEKEMSMLTEWTLMEGHLDLRDSLRAMYLAQYAAELVTMLFEDHDPHQDVFDDLEALLRELGGAKIEEVFLAFELRLLFSAGLMPELAQCLSCGRQITDKEHTYFSPASGGVICRDCEAIIPDRRSVDPRLIRMLRSFGAIVLPKTYTGPKAPFAGLRLPKLTRIQTDPINRLLIEHLKHATSRLPRMAEYVV